MIPGLGIIQDVQQALPLSPPVLPDPGGLGINPAQDNTAQNLLMLLLLQMLQEGQGQNPLGNQLPQALGSLRSSSFAEVFGGKSKKQGGPPPGP